MEDAEVVAAIVAGDSAGLAEAVDKYAVTLYGYCRAVLAQAALPAADAGEAVLDTFLVAASRLGELADPARLGPWLQAVARNECHRRLLAVGMNPQEADAAGRAAQAPVSQYLSAGLRSRILAASADDTPAGRSRRVSVTHRTTAFDRDGFPKPVTRQLAPAWRRVPAIAAASSMLAVLTASGLALALSGGHPAQQGAAPVTGGLAVASVPVTSQPAPGTNRTTQPSRTPAARHTKTPAAPAGSAAATQAPSPAPATASAVAPRSPSPSRSPSSSSRPARTAGTLLVSPAKIVLTSFRGRGGVAHFMITAAGGPVDFSITISGGSGTVSVIPASGHLAAGAQQMIAVTVASRTSYTCTIVLSPRGSVTLSIVAKL